MLASKISKKELSMLTIAKYHDCLLREQEPFKCWGFFTHLVLVIASGMGAKFLTPSNPSSRCPDNGTFTPEIFNRLFQIDNREHRKFLLAHQRSCAKGPYPANMALKWL